MYIPLDIYQHISDICPELHLHTIIKGIKTPSQFTLAKIRLSETFKGKLGKKGHLRYLYSSLNKEAMLDYIRSKNRFSKKTFAVRMLELSEDTDLILYYFRYICRVHSGLHYTLSEYTS